MRYAILFQLLVFVMGTSYAQQVTDVAIRSNSKILNQANIKGKGVYVLMGSPREKQIDDLSIMFVDLNGELKWSHSLLKKMKKENNSNILLIASESARSVYVVAYHIRSRKKTDFLIYEINESGEVSHFSFEEELPYSNNILFACASSKGLHLFVRASVKKGEAQNYVRASDGVYSAQFFIPEGSKTYTFKSMDERFNPLTTLSGQSGDTLYLYLSQESRILVYKYLVTADEMLAEIQQLKVGDISEAVCYARPQNGYYNSRDHYDIGTTRSSTGETTLSYFPNGQAYWGIQHNPSNGHTYVFATIRIFDRKVKGRKTKKKWDYMDQVHIFEFDAELKQVGKTIVWLPEAIEKVSGRIHMIRFLERGYGTHVHCQVTNNGNNVDILIFRKDKSAIAWTAAELNTGNQIRFNVRKKVGFAKSGDRLDYLESYIGSLLLDSTNTNLPTTVSEYIRLYPKAPYSKGQFTQVLEGSTDQEAVLIEFTSGKSIRILRFAPGIRDINQQFSIPKQPVFLVEEF